jgi:probable F420-dependent oxidoreductase
MKFDLNLVSAPLREMPEWARQATNAGFDGIFVAETTQDPFLPLAVASDHAVDLDLGTSIALAFPRSPMVTAVAAWDLHRACGGRFILGLGAQVRKHVERRFAAPYDPPIARLREYVQAVRHIWEAFQGEHDLNFHGEHYRLDFLPPAASPGRSEVGFPRIYLAALGPAMYRTAGAVADGAFVHPLHTVDYLRGVAEPAIADGLCRSGRRRSEFSLSTTTLVSVGTGEEGRRALARSREQLAFYCSTPAYRPVLQFHGWEDVGDKLNAMLRAGQQLDAMAAAVPDEMLEAVSITADTWVEAAQLARERYAGVAERTSFYYAPPPDVSIRSAKPVSGRVTPTTT